MAKLAPVCVKRPRIQDKYSAFILCIPLEIIFNILLILPASLLQNIMRFVCKDWNAIITDPIFVRAHLLHSLSSPPTTTTFVIQDRGLYDVRLKQAFYLDAIPYSFSFTKLELPIQAKIMGSCHGLVLLHNPTVPTQLVVVNLVTKSIITLPPLTPAGVRILRKPYTTLAFAPSSTQYKVVYVSFSSDNDEQQKSYVNPTQLGRLMAKHEVKVMVCTLGVDKSWRPIDDCKGITMSINAKDTLLNQPISSAGVYIYWVYKLYNDCLALDIDAEIMYQFTKPKHNVRDFFLAKIVKMDTCVGMVHWQSRLSHWKIWEMIDPKTDTWTTRAVDFDVVSMYSMVNSHFAPFTADCCTPLFISFKSGDIWSFCNVNRKFVLICYNYNTGKVWSAPYKWPEEHLDLPHFHVNSLLSLKNLSEAKEHAISVV